MEENVSSVTTKEEILKASMCLFYEKGYRQTSFQDICRKAHVYRGTIYYYYKEKSAIRHDVIEEHFNRCIRLAKQYCTDSGCSILLAHYIQWYKFLHDPKTRRFMVEYYEDEPVYQEEKGLSRFYTSAFEQAYSSLIDTESILPLSFASVYGYLTGMIQLINTEPSSYTAEYIFHECLASITKIWNMSDDTIKKIWSIIEPCIQALPKDQIDLTSL